MRKKIILLLIMFALSFIACNKKLCPTYSDVAPREVYYKQKINK